MPTQRRLVKESDQRTTKVSDVAEARAVLFFWDWSVSLRERPKEFFPDIWQTIYAAAILRAIKEPRFRRLQVHYETSLLAHLLPNLSFDAPSNDVFLLFDGHRLITSSKTMELAELGYDSKRRFKPQVNLLYVYRLSSDASARMYYKQFLGSPPDVSAFANILNECGISSKKYTLIGDKGFAAEGQFEALTEKELSYVIPIKRGSKARNRLFATDTAKLL